MKSMSTSFRGISDRTQVSNPTFSRGFFGLKMKVGSYVLVLLTGVAISNVSLANHPEWTPCCATSTRAEIAKNLSEAADAAKLKQAEVTSQLVELKTAAQKNVK